MLQWEKELEPSATAHYRLMAQFEGEVVLGHGLPSSDGVARSRF